MPTITYNGTTDQALTLADLVAIAKRKRWSLDTPITLVDPVSLQVHFIRGIGDRMLAQPYEGGTFPVIDLDTHSFDDWEIVDETPAASA